MTARPHVPVDLDEECSAQSSHEVARLEPASDHQRHVAEAAYFRAQQRGFTPGAELDDWLAAEREIEQLAREAT